MVIVIIEVGIPVWNARGTLPQALDSLVAQTRSMFLVCLSIDGDGVDYSDIITEYKRRGLKIRVINSDENGGPGIARQRIIDTTQCEFLMFLDSDDMLMPQAVHNLYDAIRYTNYDVIRAGFIRESAHGINQTMPADMASVTWTHGKAYRVSYLRDNNIRFLPELRTDEDAYFNLVAWNCADKRGELNELIYLWRDYKNSLTRANGESGFFKITYKNYILGQVMGMKKIYEITHDIKHKLFTHTFKNIYCAYMRAKYYKLDIAGLDEIISSLKKEPWIKEYINFIDNWMEFINVVPVGNVYEENVVFYKEPINEWVNRLLVE